MPGHRGDLTRRWIVRSGGLSIVLLLTACAAAQPESIAASASHVPASASPAGISRNEATEVARDALDDAGHEWEVVLVQAGAVGQLVPGWEESAWGQELSADTRVWRVVLAAGDLSGEVVIDFFEGSVYGSIMGIAN